MRYEFLKHAFKSEKINQKIKTSHRLIAGARGQWAPPVSETKTGDGADRRELADGEVSGSSVFTVALFSPRASTGRLSWLGGSPEQARRRPWRTAEVGGSTLAISGYGTLRRGRLLHPSDLAELHCAGEGSGWRR